MKTNQTNPSRKATQLASVISDIVINKGTCFAGFMYHGKRRNLTLGARLGNRVSGGGNWGSSYANGSLVEHNGNLYLQGIPNNEDNAPVVKRFKLDEVEDFVMG